MQKKNGGTGRTASARPTSPPDNPFFNNEKRSESRFIAFLPDGSAFQKSPISPPRPIGKKTIKQKQTKLTAYTLMLQPKRQGE